MSTPVLLNYNLLIQKAQREISRLREAEHNLDVTTALDHALNAAFTVYHLLEWRQNPTGFSKEELNDTLKESGKITKSAHGLCKEVNSIEMHLLHGIVTHTKHVTVSKPIPNKDTAPDYNPAYEDNIEYIVTENGDRLVTESGLSVITENSNIVIYFGNQIALTVLETAIKEFID